MKSILALLCLLSLPLQLHADDSTEANKKLVVDFYTEILFQQKLDKIDHYIGDIYIQHNPNVADGKQALLDLLRSFPAPEPGNKPFGEIVRVIAEDDLVVLHVKNYSWPGPNGGAVVDIFRVKDNLIVEHWDVIQAIPDTAANDNTMF